MADAKILKCPSCGASLSIQHAGAEIKCQYCGSNVLVPQKWRGAKTQAPSFDQDNAPPAEPRLPVPPSTEVTNATRQPRSRVRQTVMWLGSTAIVIVGLLLVLSFPNPISSAFGFGYARTVMTLGSEGTAPGMFQKAKHFAVDGNGNIYVGDTTPRIQKFDATGKYLSAWSLEKLDNAELRKAEAMQADRAGHVYILMLYVIYKYDGATGSLLKKFNTRFGNDIRNFLLYPDGGLLLFTMNQDLIHLDANGTEVARYPRIIQSQVGANVDSSQLGLAMDGLGNIFILNRFNPVVYKFNANGKLVTQFGSKGNDLGQFQVYTTNIAVDNQSRVYIGDGAGIKVFDSTGRYLYFISTLFQSIMLDLKITDQNEIYVLDTKSTIYKMQMNVK